MRRFVFHDNTSSKLDNRVEFPLSGLSLRPYVDASATSVFDAVDPLHYDLYGVVCHFGSQSYRVLPSFTGFPEMTVGAGIRKVEKSAGIHSITSNSNPLRTRFRFTFNPHRIDLQTTLNVFTFTPNPLPSCFLNASNPLLSRF